MNFGTSIRRRLNKNLVAAVLLASAGSAQAWTTPVEISGSDVYSYSLDLAVDGKGRAVALWYDYDASFHYRVVAALRQPGQAFGGPATLSAAGGSGYYPTLAVSKKGHAAVMWGYNTDGLTQQLKMSMAAPGASSFDAPIDLSPSDGFAIPATGGLALDKKGNASMAWTDQGEGYRLFAATRPAGGPVGTPQQVTDYYTGGPGMVQDPKGNAILFWHRNNPSTYDIEASVRPAGGTFATPLQISDASTQGVFPAGAIDKKGNAFIGWNYAGANYDPKTGMFSAPAAAPMGQGALFAFDGKGNLSSLCNSIGCSYTLSYSYRPKGGTFTVPDDMAAAYATSYASMAIDKKGNVRAVWIEDDGSAYRVHTALRPVGGTFGLPEVVSTPGVNASIARVAFNKKGDATIAWIEDDGSGDRVMVTDLPH